VQSTTIDGGRPVLELLKDPYFWLLALILFIILGSVSYHFATKSCVFFDWLYAVRNDYFEYRNYCPFSVPRGNLWRQVPLPFCRNCDCNSSPPYFPFQHIVASSFWPSCGLCISSHFTRWTNTPAKVSN
jgi:hypothetical protein